MTALEDAKQNIGKIYYPDKITVRIPISWRNGLCLPDKTGIQEETAIFHTLTFGDNFAIDHAASYEISVGGGRAFVSATEFNEYRRLLVRRNLLSWTLDIPIEREDGWITDKSWQRVSNIPGPLMDAFIDGVEEQTNLTAKEAERIDKESISLFSPNGRGISDACEAVSLFCTLGNYWEKFGIDRDKLPRMPYKEFLMLKIMIGKESEAQRRAAAPKHPISPTMIAMGGGRARPSRGIRMGD
jgi:hypothetical protein